MLRTRHGCRRMRNWLRPNYSSNQSDVMGRVTVHRAPVSFMPLRALLAAATCAILLACSDAHEEQSIRTTDLPTRSECIVGATVALGKHSEEAFKEDLIRYWQREGGASPNAAFAFPRARHVYLQLREHCTTREVQLKRVLAALVRDERITSYSVLPIPVSPSTATIDVRGHHWRSR